MTTYPTTPNGFPLPQDSTRIQDLGDAMRQIATKADEKYVDSMSNGQTAWQRAVDAEANAKAYTDMKTDGAVVQAKGYSDVVGGEMLSQAKTYSDDNDAVVLNQAEGYADSKAATTLTDAKAYTDQKVAAGGGGAATPLIGISVGLTADIAINGANSYGWQNTAGVTGVDAKHATDYVVAKGDIFPFVVGSTKFLCQQSTVAGSITLDSPGVFRINKTGSYGMSFQTGIYNVTGANLGTSTAIRLHIEVTRASNGSKLIVASGFGKTSAGSMHFASVEKGFVFLESGDLVSCRYIAVGTQTQSPLDAGLSQGSIHLIAAGAL